MSGFLYYLCSIASAEKESQHGALLKIAGIEVWDNGLLEAGVESAFGQPDFGQPDLVMLGRPYVLGDLTPDMSPTCMAAVSTSDVEPNAQCRALCVGAKEELLVPIGEFVSSCRIDYNLVDLEEKNTIDRGSELCSSSLVPLVPYRDSNYVTNANVNNAYQCADLCQDDVTCAWWVIRKLADFSYDCYQVSRKALAESLKSRQIEGGECGPFSCDCNGGTQVFCDSEESVCLIDGEVVLGVSSVEPKTSVIGGPDVCFSAFTESNSHALCLNATIASIFQGSEENNGNEEVKRLFRAFKQMSEV